ncbi:MAG TPA: DUF4123 domain-containing protein [Pyrinomonadaceae bacterium]|jgi:hypothetical protein
MKEQLGKYLFRDGTHSYAILDGASVPDLPVRLYEMNPTNLCLYRGELPPDLVYAAPYLVYLFPGTAFTDWLLTECWGKHWGIFAQSPVSIAAMRKHFRSLLTVDDENGKPLLFRYYDPRVLPPFLLTCNYSELEILFGEVKYYFAESFDAKELCRFHLAKEKLNETRLKIDVDDKN